jgi:TolB-like protein/DNA-binding winged helix-turn-helix (wHTH) protein/tetratricopeptide (TPR) repeat protein
VSSRKLRFDGWVLDPQSGDLEREGARIRLQEQPARVLQELIAHTGSVVTREQLIALLWPKGVVDFDTSLNTLIRKLRNALGDVAETPRYIETLPRRGYRFIGALDPDSGADSSASPAHVAVSAPGVPPGPAPGAGLAAPQEATPAARLETVPVSAPGTVSGPVRVAICVLPFSNLGADVEQQALSDGITEDIITELSRWRRLLEVRSRLASFKYRGIDVDLTRVARELNVRFVVEGSVRRMGDRMRITVQLIDAASGHQVWGDHFDRLQTEIFAVQDEVVQRIVSTLVGRVEVTDADRARRKHPASLEAYECVLKGNALPWDDPAGAAEATRLFEKAIQIDPGYGMAYALLAIMRARDWEDQPGDSTAKLDEAYRLAIRAVELDDGESTCHSMLAHISLRRRAFELALQHMRRAVELNPTNQWNLADMASVLEYAGQAEEALTWSARAKQIDPYFDPPWYWRQAGRAYMVLRRYQEALAMFEHIPLRGYRDAAYMAGCHARLGESERARARVAECLAKRPEFSIRHMMTKEPFKLVSDAEHIEQSLRLAGLPE